MVRLEEWLSNDRTRLTAPPPRTPHFNACLKKYSEKTLFLPRRCCAWPYSMYCLRLAALWQK